MNFAPVRLGLVGYGLGGRAFHAPLITSAPETELVGVVTTDPERRAHLAEDHPDVPAVTSLRELVDAGAEAVAISSMTGTHSLLTDEAIELGLHVVCDKPLAVDAAHARASLAKAQDAGVLYTAYQNRRWDSDFLTVRSVIDAGSVGEVYRFESRFERWAPGIPRTWWRFALTPEQGGGLRLDLMTHLVDQAYVLFGPVTEVYAELTTHRPEAAAEDDAMAVLTHASGVTSHLHASTVCGDTSRRIRLLGSEGAYVIGGVDGQEDALRAGRTPASDGDLWGVEPESTWGEIRQGAVFEPVPTQRGRWDTFYPAFARAVRGEGPVPVDPREAIAVLDILDAMALGAREHQVVTL